jgi:glycerol-3-phosphate dehydrogenase
MLPWEDHVLIGTTDKPCEPSMCPEATEQEIQCVLNEAGKYLNPEIKLRREDVLSAWSGIRPLAMDPNATSTASVSRDHLISHNPGSGAVFISGGKWTTYREMAQVLPLRQTIYRL